MVKSKFLGKKILTLGAALSLFASVASAAGAMGTSVPYSMPAPPPEWRDVNQGPFANVVPRGGVIDKSQDKVLKQLIATTKKEFKQYVYEEPQTAIKINYNLFLPADYKKGTAYPMVVFIADASTVGDDIKAPLTQGYGGLIWASAAEQAKHPCIVLVPTYKKVVIDDHTGFYVADQVETTKNLIEDVATRYGVDKNCIYGTGQSMGCMITMYLAAKHPDLYAAELLVSGQWDVKELAPLATQKFFYVAAAGDPKASKGQIDLLPVLQKQGVQVSTAVWNAKDSASELDAAANKEIAQNHKINFATFTAGSVLPAKASKDASEHMYSFDHVYTISALRDWLFNQHK